MIQQLMLTIVLGVAAIALTEFLRSKRIISNELARKIIHMCHIMVICIWIFITSYTIIILVEILSLCLVIFARKLDFFKGLRKVGRLSYGELFLPSAVIVLALLHPSKALFLVAILHVGLADSVAALIGRYARAGRYKVLGNQKSVLGTVSFFLTSTAIMLWFVNYGYSKFSLSLLPAMLAVSVLTTFVENISPWGSDNFTIPLVAYGMLVLLF